MTQPLGVGPHRAAVVDGVMFIPRQPYVPLRTLRAALAYPSSETAYKDEKLVAVLQCTGLNRLSSSLDPSRAGTGNSPMTSSNA
jgi:putative ATP-binding cassette transporter